MRRYLGLLLLMLSGSSLCFAAKGKKAILLAGRDSQSDTIGYNIVADLSGYMYTWIKSGDIILWDSPEKKQRIQEADLEGIENTNHTSFIKSPSVFIYETWNYTRHKYSFGLKGFSFIGHNEKGEDVLFGYVERTEKLKDLLTQAYLSANVYAPYGITLWQVLMNKSFDYDLVYWNDAPVTDIKRSAQIKKIVIGKKKNLNRIQVPDAKLVEYVIQTGPSRLSERSVFLMKHLESFFNDNIQEFYNYGGDQIYSYLKKSPVLISEIHVTELLTIKDRTLYGKTLLVTPYIFGLPMKPIPLQQLLDWKLELDGHDWEEELTDKEFYFTIIKVNNTIVPGEMADATKDKLYAKKWDELLP